ncbi:hypothetical protein [Pedobacter chitinilyticus]|uniref:Uncharacterized protein n=1 Tax=Pedobacter chitinilyticus TaxID=2233776 RepID=A0A443YMM2_9SPHI|nr:hypothetical protein [Pedobacter chitinilyticus]RWU05007.1 hypothetical protein DPV69_17750 [Pedobacter chitinilyticus]
MKTTRNKYYLLNFVFLFCLVILLLNDHFFKYQFANALTGKLSDVVGIILLPLLLAFVFPRLKQQAVWISGLLFVFWKLPYSQSLIDFYNQYTFIQTSRIVDLTDLYVLLLLPIPYYLIKRMDDLEILKIKKLHPALLLFPTVFALIATSPPASYYYSRTDGNLDCYRCYLTVKYKQREIVAKLREFDIVFDSIAPLDSFALQRVPRLATEDAHVYRLNQLVIDNDTLRNLDFTMLSIKDGRTKISFNGMQVSQDISTPKLKRKLKNYYKKILFRALKSKLKQ